MKKTQFSNIVMFTGVLVLGALTGCVEGPGYGAVYVGPPAVSVEAGVVLADDYVYYPRYQVYYCNNRHEYIYLDGHRWVTRPTPPHVSVDVLFASPSVRLDFHDSPSVHHAAVVRQYPKHWSPSHSHHEYDHDNGKHRGRD